MKTKPISLLLALLFLLPVSQPAAGAGESAYTITAADFIQRLDGSTVTQPLTQALADSLFGDAAPVVVHNKTSQAIRGVINGDKGIAFVTYPSAQDFADAAAAGVDLECVPVVKDAFVFLVNTANAAKGLTQRQIRDIYSGKITGGWIELMGPDFYSNPGGFDKIQAFQRVAESGSQSGMVNFMGDTPIMIPESERYAVEMMGMLVDEIGINLNAIGYSYYYFVENQTEFFMYNWNVKYIEVDGVLPSNTTVKNGSYPLITPYYAVFRSDAPQNGFARALLRYTFSDEGQSIAELAGYVGAKVIGDLNYDGKINVTDARLILQHIVGKITLREDQKICADVNNDTHVDINDARLILQYLVGKIKAFSGQGP